MLSNISTMGIHSVRPDVKQTRIRPGAEAQDPLDCAAAAIRAGEYSRARRLLREAAAADMENPEAFNLLGISYEKEGNRLKAARCYRVAYYLDQTFRPAADNLERVGAFWNGPGDVAWGLTEEEK